MEYMKTKILFKKKLQSTKIIIKNNYVNSYLKKLNKSNKKIFCIVDNKVKKIIEKKIIKKIL